MSWRRPASTCRSPSCSGGWGDVYEERYGLDPAHLTRLAELNYANAQRNPNAQTRNWLGDVSELHEGKYAMEITGRLALRDCSQITDGAVSLMLASESAATAWAERRGIELEDVPRIEGWGHRTAALTFDTKILTGRGRPLHPAAHAAGDHRRVRARRRRRCLGDRRDRDARLLHDLALHGDRPLRHDRAGALLRGDRGRRDRLRGQAADEPVGRPDRPADTLSGRPACARRSTPTDRSRARPATTRCPTRAGWRR